MEKKVLTVDDEYQVREFISTVLEEEGYTALQAENGEEALKIIGETRPALIVLDVLMPKKSGIKLYRELKTTESLKDIPVLIYSGIARRTFLRSQSAQSEFGGESIPEPEGYIEKPAKPASLVKIFRKFLD